MSPINTALVLLVFGAFMCQPSDAQYGGGFGCECTNPWLGQIFSEHQGDPANTCYGPAEFCYVDCRSDCRDCRPAKGRGRCWSKLACRTDIAADIAPIEDLGRRI
eukprot:GFUD01101171.1.p1 GENE.GFUD01101171.1~~GFUD01101171.1.p1  ORF type:complete len:105 (-),score=30.73 GFUD01101171.1:231-545(-)